MPVVNPWIIYGFGRQINLLLNGINNLYHELLSSQQMMTYCKDPDNDLWSLWLVFLMQAYVGLTFTL